MKLSTRRYLLWLAGNWIVIGLIGFSVGYGLSAWHTVEIMPSISDALSVAIFQACKVSL